MDEVDSAEAEESESVWELENRRSETVDDGESAHPTVTSSDYISDDDDDECDTELIDVEEEEDLTE